MTDSAENRPAEQDPAHVEPGGRRWRADLARASVVKFSVSEMDNNVYLVSCAESGATLLIDAADDPDRIAAVIDAEAGGSIDLLVTTHRHWDHHRALEAVTRRFAVPTAAGHADADDLPVPPDRRLYDGDVVQIGALSLEVIGLRGHTPGSVALGLRDSGHHWHLFTGDSLFPGGPGKTPGQTEFTSLMNDLELRIFDRFDDATVVHPGHGDSTTLGAERPHLSHWRARGW